MTVESVRRSRWARTTIQPASVKAFDSADLYARAPGYLTSVRVDIGSRVKKDEIVAELFDPGLSATVEKARAEVERAQAHVARAMAALDVARAAADAQHLKTGFAESLAERRGVSRYEVALARAAEAEAKARVTMARAEIAEAESEVRDLPGGPGQHTRHRGGHEDPVSLRWRRDPARLSCRRTRRLAQRGEGRPPLHGRPHGHHAGRGLRARP